MLAIVVASSCAFITSPTRTTQLTPRRGGALLPRALPTAIVGQEADLEGVLKRSKHDPSREKQDTSLQSVELPTVGRVDGPLVQTLATVCAKLYDHSLYTVFKPVEPVTDALKDKLEQPYELVKKGGQYKEGGNYTADGNYTDGDGANVSGFEIFNKNTTQVVGGKSHGTASLASYGTVIDGFTDFHGEDQAAIPPFAALIVQPKDEKAVRTRPVSSLRPFLVSQLLETECCPPPAGPHPHPGLAWFCHGAGLDQRWRVLSHSLYALPPPLYTPVRTEFPTPWA